MKKEAILHIPLSQYAYATGEKDITIRLRTAKGDLKECQLYYGDRVDQNPVIRMKKKKMTCVSSDDLFDYYEADLKDKFNNDKDLIKKVTIEDLKKFGMIPEFLGRLPIIYTLDALDKDMYIKILKEPKNAILKQYQKLLALDEVDLEFDDGALEAIAEKAMEKDTGARALRAIIEEFMLDIMYEIPKDENIGRVTITKEYIEGCGGPKIEIRSTETLPGIE